MGSLVGLMACRPSVGSVIPVNMAPVSEAQVGEWIAATAPRESRLHKFKWLFQDERASAGGRGSARIAPPDSLRFDAADVYGTQPTAAVVIGDTPLWIEPPDALQKLVPSYPLLWAMFGVARRPEPGMELRGFADDALTAWRYAGQADTVDYRYTRGRPSKLVVEVRRAGQVIGHAETTIGDDGAPLSAKLVVPSAPAKLNLTFLSTTRMAFALEIWHHRTP